MHLHSRKICIPLHQYFRFMLKDIFGNPIRFRSCTRSCNPRLLIVHYAIVCKNEKAFNYEVARRPTKIQLLVLCFGEKAV